MSSNTRIGMIRCEHCGRQFNPHSGARHIPWCANQKSERRKHKLSSEKREALERYKWRINYRPSNQLLPASRQQQQTRLVGGSSSSPDRHDRVTKRSSTNSSATLSSSASASSTASVASTLNEARETLGVPAARSQQLANNHHYNQPTISNNRHSAIQVGQLKRSISSLTMTRQPGNISIVSSSGYGQQANGAGNYSRNNKMNPNRILSQQQLRAKSVSDLYNMSEIVETLSKRMDEIYAQNQILLARISSSASNNNQNNTLKDGLSARAGCQSPEDSCSANRADSIVRCHHCKSSCLESANYCHKCGCKVRANTPSPG